MTTFHYQGELLSRDENTATYRFLPDHVMAPEIQGMFRIRLADWSTEIVKPAGAEENGLVSKDDICVAALVHKIEKAFASSERLPQTVFFIA